MKTIYLTKMNRWGNSEGHTYICNASESRIVALFIGENHGKEYRGGKYSPEIIEYSVPDECNEIWVEMCNLENEDNSFTYKIHTSGESRINLSVAEAEESSLTIWNHTIATEDDVLNTEEEIDYIINHSLNCYSDEVKDYIMHKKEALESSLSSL